MSLSLHEKQFQSSITKCGPSHIKKYNLICHKSSQSRLGQHIFQEDVDVEPGTKTIKVKLKFRVPEQNTKRKSNAFLNSQGQNNQYTVKKTKMFFKQQEDNRLKNESFYSFNRINESRQIPRKEDKFNESQSEDNYQNRHKQFDQSKHQEIEQDKTRKTEKKKNEYFEQVSEGRKTLDKNQRIRQINDKIELNNKNGSSKVQTLLFTQQNKKQFHNSDSESIQKKIKTKNVQNEQEQKQKQDSNLKQKIQQKKQQKKHIAIKLSRGNSIMKDQNPNDCSKLSQSRDNSIVKRRRIFQAGIFLTTCPYKNNKKSSNLSDSYSKTLEDLQVPQSIIKSWKIQLN